MSKVYALFVGINKYTAVRPLAGCVEDINAVETLFKKRIPPASLDLLTLKDADATRENIISGFRTHLRQARADDHALFYYCGHGSLESKPEEWKKTEATDFNQTLVPVDARANNVFDIADKELSALLTEVAADGAQVVVITDSCHSGGNTRGAEDDTSPKAGVGRMTPAENRQRTLTDYLPLAQELYDPKRVAEVGTPQPRHIAIAACQDNEVAKEFPQDPPRRGAFSLAFEQSVIALGPSATYVDIVNAVRIKVRDSAAEQVPNIYVSGGASGHDVFLGGKAGQVNLTVDPDKDGRWWLSAGATFGIQPPAQGNVTEVAIYERGAFDEGRSPAPVATGVVTDVLQDRAQLKVTAVGKELDPKTHYIGTVTRLGTPALQVVVEAAAGGEEAAARVKARLTGSSPFFSVVDSVGKVPAATVMVGANAMTVLADGAPLGELTFGFDDASLKRLTVSCTHLARWFGLRDLAPAGSALNGQVHIDFVPVNSGEQTAPDDRPAQEAVDGTVSLAYTGSTPPKVQVRLRNTSSERLYVALYDLTDSYKISKQFADWIPAGVTAEAYKGAATNMSFNARHGASVRSTTDYYKVVAAIEDFDADQLALPPLLVPTTRDSEPVPPPELKPPVRSFDGTHAFWGTSVQKIVTTR